MLILSRKVNENIVIDGRIIVRILRLDGDVVKIGIQAPSDVSVHRQEVFDEIQRVNAEALLSGRPPVPQFPAKHLARIQQQQQPRTPSPAAEAPKTNKPGNPQK
jgi:carbon storage regulator